MPVMFHTKTNYTAFVTADVPLDPNEIREVELAFHHPNLPGDAFAVYLDPIAAADLGAYLTAAAVRLLKPKEAKP